METPRLNPPVAVDQQAQYNSWLREALYGPRKSELDINVYKSNLDLIVDKYVSRINKDYDVVEAQTGFEGTGKSTLAIIKAYKIARKLGMPFNLETNVLYAPTYSQLIAALRILPNKSSLVVDEAIRIGYSRNWNKSGQKEQNTVFTMIRAKNLYVALCIPAFNELDNFFRQNRILTWSHCFKRGSAGLFVKIPNPFATDPFNLIMARKLIEAEGKDQYDIKRTIRILKERLPNFVCSYTFPKLAEGKDEKYKALKRKYTVTMPQEEKSNTKRHEDILKSAVVDLYESSEEWTYPKIAKKYGVSEYFVREAIKEKRKEGEKKVEEPQEKEEGSN